MTFNIRSRVGWVRLWALVCALSSAFFAAPLFRDIPNKESIDLRYRLSQQETTDPLAGLFSYWGKMTKGQHEPSPQDREQQRKLEYEQEISELPQKRLQHIASWVGIWVAFCLALRIVGEMIAWVIRGFRSSAPN